MGCECINSVIHNNETRQCQLISQYYSIITLLNRFFQACNQKHKNLVKKPAVGNNIHATRITMQSMYHKTKKGLPHCGNPFFESILIWIDLFALRGRRFFLGRRLDRLLRRGFRRRSCRSFRGCRSHRSFNRRRSVILHHGTLGSMRRHHG